MWAPASGTIGVGFHAKFPGEVLIMSAAHQTPLADVRGKTAFITGGSSGIGLAIARVCSAAGMKVAITYRSEKHRDEALALFPAGNPGVMAIKLDTTDRDGMARAADEVQARFGKVHLLVNNAGVGITIPLTKATYNDWDWGTAVNIDGVFNGIHTFLPRMLAHGEGGHIAAVSSAAGLTAGMLGIYVTTKYAVMGMVESLRCELEGRNIGTSVCCPGLTKTQIFNTERNRPAELMNPGGPIAPAPPPGVKDAPHVDLMAAARDPMDVAEEILAGIRRNDLFIMTHQEFEEVVRERADALLASFPAEKAPLARVEASQTFVPKIYAEEAARRRRG
jgi:NAD(P)-dependent dehydrogenase (short-subunit alcohol dehydrogenase family)